MKKLYKVFVLGLCMFVLAGCMKMNITIDVDSEGAYTTSAKIMYSQELLSSMGTSEQEMLDSMKQSYNENNGDVQVEEVKETIDSKEYVGLKVTSKVQSDEIKVEKTDKDITLTIPVDFLQNGGSSSESSSSGMDSSQLASYSLDQLRNYGMEMTAVINMPGKAESNVGTVDGKTVTVDLLELMKDDSKKDIKEIVVKSSTSAGGLSTGLIIGIVAAVVVIAAVIFFLMKKKKTDTPAA